MSTRSLNKCQTRPVGGASASRLTKALSVRVTLLPFAICRIIFSASSNRPCEISHLGDSGINLLKKRITHKTTNTLQSTNMYLLHK